MIPAAVLQSLRSQPRRPAELTAAYVFLHLKERHGHLWRGSRAQGAPRLSAEEAGQLSPVDVLRAYQLKGVGRDSQAGLLGWLEGRYPLDLRFDIPSTEEMLEIQCRGRRYVTLMIEPEQQFQTYGRHAGALEFLLHDLEHAHKFFGEPGLSRGQVSFFRLLKSHLPQLLPLMKADPAFRHEMHYLMADMNSHPVHLLKYLKAICLMASRRRPEEVDYEALCARIFRSWQMPPEVKEAAVRINTPGLESADDQARIAEWFCNSLL